MDGIVGATTVAATTAHSRPAPTPDNKDDRSSPGDGEERFVTYALTHLRTYALTHRGFTRLSTRHRGGAWVCTVRWAGGRPASWWAPPPGCTAGGCWALRPCCTARSG